MGGLDAERWSHVKALFDEIVDQPEEERVSRIAASGADPDVTDEVQRLLAAAGQADDFFARTPSLQGFGDPPELAPGARVGAWRVVKAVGRGGMGVVYEAERATGGFDQRAALKVIDIHASAWSARFEDERQIVARLDHPGIARLYDGGFDLDGQPYMAMEFIEGRTLIDYARVRDLNLKHRLGLFARVCEAVAYAHRNLVIHLDIKPGNVFVTDDGEVKLLDFGGARVLESAGEEGVKASMLTPAYAAPEQIDHHPVSTATDVYALGALLRELVAEAPTGVRKDHLSRRDLDAVVARAMRPDPNARYGDANALGGEVARILRRDPVAARETDRGYVILRLIARYRWAAAAIAAIIVALAGGVIATALEVRRAIAERDHFEAEVARGNAAMDYFALMFHDANSGPADKPTTPADLLRRSAENLDQSFRGQPAKYGRVVEFLASLYSEMTDDVGGQVLERRYLASAAAGADPLTANRVRLMLAQSLLRQGDRAAASATLQQAQRFWLSAPDRYIGELARSRIVEGQILKGAKDIPGAIAVLRLGLAEAARPSSGVSGEDVSNLENSLALALMADSQFDQAEAMMNRVRTYRDRQGRTDDDLLIAIQNQGAIALARGYLPRAEGLLRDAIDRRRASFGPSGAMAAAEVNLAKTLLLEGRPRDAAVVADEAQAIGQKFTGPRGPPTVAATVARSIAQVEARLPSAQAAVDAALGVTASMTDPQRALALAAASRRADGLGHSAEAAADRSVAIAIMAGSGRTAALSRPLFDQVLKR